MMNSLKIIVADKHEIFRTRICGLLNRQECIDIILEVEGEKELLHLIEKHNPDIVLIDQDMIADCEHDILHAINKTNKSIKIIVLALHVDVRIVHESIGMGAFGFLLKKTSYQEVMQAIDTVSQGNVFLCKESAKILF